MDQKGDLNSLKCAGGGSAILGTSGFTLKKFGSFIEFHFVSFQLLQLTPLLCLKYANLEVTQTTSVAAASIATSMRSSKEAKALVRVLAL